MKKKYTMKDIARECGVSTATVSYVLNDVQTQSISAETKKKVLQFANVVGYRSSASARALATGRANAFGVYAPYAGNSALKHALLRALAEASEQAGCGLRLLTDRCLREQVTDLDAIFAVDVSIDEFLRLGDNTFAPLLYLGGQIDEALFYCITFDASRVRREAAERTLCAKVALVADEPRCAPYAAYLRGCFDAVLTPAQAAETAFDADTAVLCAPGVPLRALHVLTLGGEELPLPYAAYASTAVSVAQKAIERDESLGEHHIRI